MPRSIIPATGSGRDPAGNGVDSLAFWPYSCRNTPDPAGCTRGTWKQYSGRSSAVPGTDFFHRLLEPESRQEIRRILPEAIGKIAYPTGDRRKLAASVTKF